VLVELFVVSNLLFLSVDVFIAHSVNAFARWAEWVPIGFSLAAPVVLLGTMAFAGLAPPLKSRELTRGQPWHKVVRGAGLAIGWGALLVGISGMLLHLESQFFADQTLKNLVYTAPFAAPLAYAGLGLLIILNRMVDAQAVEWARWVLFLALGGFVGNFVLSLADHAQNGFFQSAEWIPVVASAAAVGSLVAALLIYDNLPLLRVSFGVVCAQAVVGVLGFGYHLQSISAAPMSSLWEKVLYGAPMFAPLLFADLALLAGIALWALAGRRGTWSVE
jgi:hypothetical protein